MWEDEPSELNDDPRNRTGRLRILVVRRKFGQTGCAGELLVC
jgi:hypothetical protein